MRIFHTKYFALLHGGGCLGLCSPIAGSLCVVLEGSCPLQDAQATQCFGAEPFPGAKEGEFGVGQAGFS